MSTSARKQLGLALGCGFIIGIIWFIGVRFALYQKEEIHYHANFAVYVDGQKETFDSFAFYEEVQSCGTEAAFNPNVRTHMHDSVSHVVHVHDEGVTWGHFFANLGYTLGDDLLETDDGIFIDKTTSSLTFTLNGQEVSTIANQAIHSEDVLLINYGNDSEVALAERYEDIIKDAAEYNQRDDPSACTGGKPVTFTERLKAAIGFKE